MLFDLKTDPGEMKNLADETPVRCQDPDVPGKTAQGWL
jgi:hypothetical protein